MISLIPRPFHTDHGLHALVNTHKKSSSMFGSSGVSGTVVYRYGRGVISAYVTVFEHGVDFDTGASKLPACPSSTLPTAHWMPVDFWARSIVASCICARYSGGNIRWSQCQISCFRLQVIRPQVAPQTIVYDGTHGVEELYERPSES